MSQTYRAVGWNRQKRRYDATIAAGVATFLALFVAGGFALDAEATIETLLIRACGTAAFFLLHIVLSIGPLCRLDRRFLPLLYNRRHLGVTTFLLAAVHGSVALVQFHALGDVNPLASVLVTSRSYTSLADFPFQPLGLAALTILLAMAATSHDFWLRTLSAPAWKTLHMLVYLAYALVVAHVSLGALQAERSPVLPAVLLCGIAVVTGLHLAAAARERRGDVERAALAHAFVDVCAVDDIPDRRAKTVCLSGERVAVFKYDGHISAVSNVCRHQNGPLGEGKVVGGCIVCPWHGYEYAPADGCAPPPFTEKLPTFAVKVVSGRVLVHPAPNPPGTFVEPARLTTVLP
ncbi:MAG TPA: Rieske 2Fe-2S domain-containing protein [Vicinamibacterales bacterium]|nr:Rieske 2Fe-2S domain-containing protein [Vicinamibacterales bacterium]